MSFDEGLYRFQTTVDDGMRLYIDDDLVINAWEEDQRRELSGDHWLEAGEHSLRVEYFEAGNEALIWLRWEKDTTYPKWRGEYWSNQDLDGPPTLVAGFRTGGPRASTTRRQ